ncbi:MAG: hypothetical protein LBI84_04865 [Propionibacteriaceae bacterium]|jgi:hypothetical protein|nr:hypothetical protein [Propionibacteriaceae bacterium]
MAKTDIDEARYGRLAEWAESDEWVGALTVRELAGEDSRAATRALLMAATEEDPTGRALVEAAAAVRPGRPPLDQSSSSTVMRFRLSAALGEEVRQLAGRDGVNVSQWVREAVASRVLAESGRAA